MDRSARFKPQSVDEIFLDFLGRRVGLVKALTTDYTKFYQQCDPEKENLYLYGFPNQQWKVDLPVEEVPPELPEPVLGINFARDEMNEKDWISKVAAHTDAWLLSVSFYFCARFGFDKTDRERLFAMINEVPTITEVVTEAAQKQMKESTSVSNHNSNMSKLHSKGGSESGKDSNGKKIEYKDDMVNEEDEEDTICGACGEKYASDGFWICCDACEEWFHGMCVKMTPARAELLKHYMCPSCHYKQALP